MHNSVQEDTLKSPHKPQKASRTCKDCYEPYQDCSCAEPVYSTIKCDCGVVASSPETIPEILEWFSPYHTGANHFIRQG